MNWWRRTISSFSSANCNCVSTQQQQRVNTPRTCNRLIPGIQNTLVSTTHCKVNTRPSYIKKVVTRLNQLLHPTNSNCVTTWPRVQPYQQRAFLIVLKYVHTHTAIIVLNVGNPTNQDEGMIHKRTMRCEKCNNLFLQHKNYRKVKTVSSPIATVCSTRMNLRRSK